MTRFVIAGFMFFWGWVFIVATTLTGLFKSETADREDEQPEGVVDTYKILLKIICLPAVRSYCLILLTAKVRLLRLLCLLRLLRLLHPQVYNI